MSHHEQLGHSVAGSHRRGLVLAVCCISMLMVGIDSTAVVVALPSIGHTFHTAPSSLSWIIDAYTLVLATLLMLSASMADRFGRKLIFRIGLGAFVLSSALCAIAPSLGWLIAFRALQGVGGSMLNPVSMAIISNVFTERAERARAIGLWAGVNGLSFAAGPLLGGLIVGSSLGWRWIFLINVPIGLIAIATITKVVPESKAPKPRKVDVPGQILLATLLSTLVFGVIEGPHLGWSSPAIVSVFAVSLASMIAFVIVEPRVIEPLVDLKFFRSIPFSAATLMALFCSASLSTFLYLNSVYLQDGRGYSPLHTGLMVLPLAAICIVWGPITGRVLGRFGSRIPLTIAGFAFIAPALILTHLSLTTPVLLILLTYALVGFANSSAGAPITHTAVSGMPRSQAGVAAGINSAGRQIGQTVGIAIAGMTLATTATRTPIELAAATHTAWIINVGYGVAVVALGVIGTTRYARSTANEHLTPSPEPPAPAPAPAVAAPSPPLAASETSV